MIGAMVVASPLGDADVPSMAEKVSKIRILFGHQSVGGNLLTGLEEVSGARIRSTNVSTPGSSLSDAGSIATLSLGINDFFVGSNEAPRSKISAFKKKLEQVGGNVEVALFKF